MDPYHAALAERLRLALVERDLSQAELARRTQISRGTINKIVNAKRMANAAQLGRIAHELELELGELLFPQLIDACEEVELLELQLRKAVLRAQRAEQVRADAGVAASEREARIRDDLRAVEAELAVQLAVAHDLREQNTQLREQLESLTHQHDVLLEQREGCEHHDARLDEAQWLGADPQPASRESAVAPLDPDYVAKSHKARMAGKIAGSAVDLIVSTVILARSLRS